MLEVGKNGELMVYTDYIYNRMVDFTFPLQLKGACLPQKKCFALDLIYSMVGIA